MHYKNEPDEETKKEWENDPNNWIWGMFYYNPNDKRPYFQKKIREFGWHANYANSTTILTTTLLILVVFIFIKFANLTN